MPPNNPVGLCVSAILTTRLVAARRAVRPPIIATTATPLPNRNPSPSPHSPSRPTTATASSTQSSSTSWSAASSSPARTPPPCPTASPPTAVQRARPRCVITSGLPSRPTRPRARPLRLPACPGPLMCLRRPLRWVLPRPPLAPISAPSPATTRNGPRVRPGFSSSCGRKGLGSSTLW